MTDWNAVTDTATNEQLLTWGMNQLNPQGLPFWDTLQGLVQSGEVSESLSLSNLRVGAERIITTLRAHASSSADGDDVTEGEAMREEEELLSESAVASEKDADGEPATRKGC